MKRFIEAYPDNSYSIAYSGYRNLINVNQVMVIYKIHTNDGYQYNIIVNFGSTTETWIIDEKTYNELLNLELQ